MDSKRIRHSGVAFAALALAGVSAANQPPAPSSDGPSKEAVQSVLDRSSRRFVANNGQWNDRAEFLARSGGLDVWYTKTGLVFDAYRRDPKGRRGHRVAMRFVGGLPTDFSGKGKIAGRTDFVAPRTGKRSSSESFTEIESNVYRGVKMRSYFDGAKPRYDLIVAPGSDPSKIRFRFDGARVNRVSARTLDIVTSVGPIRQDGLEAYQVVNGVRRTVPAEFSVKDGVVGFRLGKYDRSLPLTIDPLVYGSYYGGNGGADTVASVVSDASGITYMTGYTETTLFPAIFGPYGYELNGARDGFVARLQGDAYLHDYSAYFGGNGSDEGKFAQIDPFGNLWIVGKTTSTDFPGIPIRTVRTIRSSEPLANGGLRVGGNANAPLRRGEAEWTLSVGNQSRVLPFDASASRVRDAFVSMDPSLAGHIFVQPAIGNPNGDLYRITFDPGFEREFDLDVERVLNEDLNAEISQGLGATLAVYGATTNTFDDTARDQVQKIVPRGSRGTGLWILGFQAPTGIEATDIFDEETTAAELDAALERLPGIGANNVQVRGTFAPSGFTVTFGGTLNTPQPMLLVADILEPKPTLSVINGQGNDLFLMRWKKDDSTFLNPLPTETRRIGSINGDDSVNGFAIQQIPNAPAGTAFDLVLAGTATGAVPEVPQPWTRTSGFILRYRYNGTLETVPNACRYLAGSATVVGRGVALDSQNNAYVTGTIFFSGNASTNPADPQFRNVFETTSGTYDNARLLRNTDTFIRKYTADGTLSYSVLLGGNGNDVAGGYVVAGDTSEVETGSAIAVDAGGNAYVTGVCTSFNFPRTRNVFGEIFTDEPQIFVTKINGNASSIIYSTNLRTTNNIWFDARGRIFPAATNPLGEGAGAKPAGISVDSRGNAYITGNLRPAYIFPTPLPDPAQMSGQTFPGIPTTADALDAAWTTPVAPQAATTEGFLLVLNPTATGLVHGSFIGGYYDEVVMAPYVDAFGDVWVFGRTSSTHAYERTPAMGMRIPYPPAGAPLGELGNLLSPTAFKPVGEETGGTGEARSYGNWARIPGPVPPLLLPGIGDRFSNQFWDGFVTKIRVAAPTVSSVVVTPSNVPGGFGASTTVTVTLSSAAPVGGADIVLSLSNSGVSSFSATGVQDTITISLAAGATTGTATIFTSGVAANTQVQVQASYQGSFKIAQFTVVPWLQQFTITPSSVIGGNEVNGRIVLAANAPAAGVIAQLSTDDPSLISFPDAAADGTITIPNGQNTFSFRIATAGVNETVLRRVRVTILGVTRSQDLTLTRAGLLSIAFSPNRVPGGDDAQGVVRLNGQAAVDTPVTVAVVGNPPGYVLRGADVSGNTVIVRRGTSSSTFALGTPSVTAEVQRQVTATLGATTVSTVLTVFPDPVVVDRLTISPNTVPAGVTTTGTVNISAAAPVGGIAVSLSSSDPSRATVPISVRVPEGQRTASFSIVTALRSDGGTVQITASRTNSSVSATLTITPGSFTISVTPSSVLGGATVAGRITVSSPAPAGGLRVNLSASSTAVTLPASVTILAGATSAEFTIATTAVSSTQNVRITGTLPNGTTGAANLEVRGIGLSAIAVVPARGETPISDLRPGVAYRIRVNLESPATTAVTVAITADRSLFASLPATITVPAGSRVGYGPLVSRRFARPLRTRIAANIGESVRSIFVNLLR